MVKKGNYFIIDYGSVHSYCNTKEFQILNCLFFLEVIDETLAGCYSFNELLRICLIRYHRQFLDRTPVNRIFKDEDNCVLNLLEGIQREYHGKGIGYRGYVNSGNCMSCWV